MNMRDADAALPAGWGAGVPDGIEGEVAGTGRNAGVLRPLLADRPVAALGALPSVVIGELVALADDGRTPMVLHAGNARAVARARSTVDLHGAHIGKQVVLVFEQGDPDRPVVMGVLRDGGEAGTAPAAGRVEVDSDGERLLVTAAHQMVLRCGKASITLTHAGKVLIDGTYVSSRSSGVNRVKGGSVQLN